MGLTNLIIGNKDKRRAKKILKGETSKISNLIENMSHDYHWVDLGSCSYDTEMNGIRERYGDRFYEVMNSLERNNLSYVGVFFDDVRGAGEIIDKIIDKVEHITCYEGEVDKERHLNEMKKDIANKLKENLDKKY